MVVPIRPLTALTLAIVLAGCGGSSTSKPKPRQTTTVVASSASAPPAIERDGVVELDSDPTGRPVFLASEAQATAGKVMLRMRNRSALPENIALRGAGVDAVGPVVANGGTSTVTATLKPGTYAYYSSLPGLEAAGMRGRLTVLPPGTTLPSKVAPGPAPAPPVTGKALFVGDAGCGACHTLAAAGATGTVGPNLDRMLRRDCQTAASKRTRGSTLEECIRAAITNPDAYVPEGYQRQIMPVDYRLRLTPAELQALVTYLAAVAR